MVELEVVKLVEQEILLLQIPLKEIKVEILVQEKAVGTLEVVVELLLLEQIHLDVQQLEVLEHQIIF